MHLSRIEVRRLGQVRDLAIGDLSPELNIVYGPNEAGKSTVRDAIRYALFGFPPSKPSKDAVDVRPYSGVDREVAVRFSGDGIDLRLDRIAEGRKATAGALTVSPAGADSVYAELVSGVDDRQYHTMWNVSLANLAGIDPSRDSAKVLSALLAAEHGTEVSPSAAITTLESKLNRTFSTSGKPTGPTLKSAVEEVTALRQQLADARRDAGTVATKRTDLGAVEAQLESLLMQRRSLRFRASELNQDGATLRGLIARQPEVTESYRLADERYRSTAEQANAAMSPETQRVLSVAREVHAIESERALAEEKFSDIARQSEVVLALRDSLAKYEHVPDVFDEAEAVSTIQAVERMERELARTSDELSIAESHVDAEARRAETHQTQPSGTPSNLNGLTIGTLVGGAIATASVWLITHNLLATTVVGIVFAVVGVLLGVQYKLGGGPTAPTGNSTELASARAVRDLKLQALRAAEQAWVEYLSSRPELANVAPSSPSELVVALRRSSDKARIKAEISDRERAMGRATELHERWVSRVLAAAEVALGGDDATHVSADQLSLMVAEAEKLASKASHAGESLAEAGAALTNAQRVFDEHATATSDLLRRYGAESTPQATQMIEDQLEQLNDALERVDGEVSRLESQRGELQHAISEAESSRDVELLDANLERATERLAALTRSYTVTLIAKTILERAVEHFQGAGTPSVLDQASTILERLTGGAYVGIEVSESGDGLTIVGDDGTRKEVGQLSVGTLEQLYLAIRFGALLALPDRGKHLPILLDEVLANYDESRSTFAYDAIASVAKTRQVVFFTCREEVAAGLAAAGASQGLQVARVSMDSGRVTA